MGDSARGGILSGAEAGRWRSRRREPFPLCPLVGAHRATRGAPVASQDAEATAMGRALALAALGLGETSPNPSVGAVILDPSGRPVGEGRTAPVGESA